MSAQTCTANALSPSPIDGMNSREVAEAFAKAGLWVFRLRPSDKRPARTGWQQEATRDPEQVRKLWGDSAWNIGIFTGRFGDADALLVVDVDSPNHGAGKKDGGATLRELELAGQEFPPTLENSTPTGGRHLVYSVPAAVRQGVDVLGDGLDIRSAGGYIVAPGSTLTTGAYGFAQLRAIAPAPQWLIDKCGAPRAKSVDRRPLSGIDPKRAAKRVIDYLQTAERSVKGAGGDQAAYRVAAKCLSLGTTPEQTLDLMLSEHWDEGCGWSAERLDEKVRHAHRYMLNTPGADAPEAQFEAVEVEDAPAVPQRPNPFKPLRLADLRGLPWPEWTVRGVIPAAGMGLIFGPSKSGKTFLALDIAGACARGVPWAGRPTRKGVAVYVGLEGQARTRALAYAVKNGLSDVDIHDLILFEQPPLNLLDATKQNNSVAELIAAVRGATAGRPVALTIIDTLAQATPGGDENTSVMMGAAIGNAKRIARELGGVLVLVHHAGKQEAAGARGHSSLTAAADFEIAVSRPNDGAQRYAKVTKVKDAEDGAEWGFTLETVPLGERPAAEGEAPELVTSCVVAGLQATGSSANARPRIKLNDKQTLLLRLLREIEAATSGDRGVPLDDWRARVFELWELEADLEPKERAAAVSKRRSAFNEAKNGLLSKDLIEQQAKKGRPTTVRSTPSSWAAA